MVNRSIAHKKAIQAEMQRREEVKNEKRRAEEEAARAKERRRERRKCLKEQKRIQELSEVLMLTVVPGCEQKEYTVSLPIHDVRDYNPENPVGIYTFGGFAGELMLSLQSMVDCLRRTEDNIGFELKADQVMKFMEELMNEGYPLGVCHLKIT